MSRFENSEISKFQRILYTKKGMRRKVEKRLKKTLLEFGVDSSQIYEAIKQLKEGKIKIVDESLMKDVACLIKFDSDILTLETKINKNKTISSQKVASFE